MKRVREFIISEEGIMVWTILLLTVMVSHTAYVFYSHAADQNIFNLIMAVVYAVSVEIAILVFVLKGRKRLSVAFGVFQVTINLFYYYTTLNEYAPLLLSLEIPLALAAYSHETFISRKAAEKESEVREELQTIEAVKVELLSKLNVLDVNNQTLVDKFTLVSSKLNELELYVENTAGSLDQLSIPDTSEIQNDLAKVKTFITKAEAMLRDFTPEQLKQLESDFNTLSKTHEDFKRVLENIRDSHPTFKNINLSWMSSI